MSVLDVVGELDGNARLCGDEEGVVELLGQLRSWHVSSQEMEPGEALIQLSEYTVEEQAMGRLEVERPSEVDGSWQMKH